MEHTKAEELGRVLAVWLAMTLGMAVVLAAFNAVPAVLGGEPRGVRSFADLADLERVVKTRIVLPAYFPAALAWPPASIRLYSGPPVGVAVAFAPASGRQERLTVYQTTDADRTIPAALRPAAGVILQEADVPVAGRAARLRRIALDGGGLAHQLTWSAEGRRITYEWNGAVEDLLLMANSAERRRR